MKNGSQVVNLAADLASAHRTMREVIEKLTNMEEEAERIFQASPMDNAAKALGEMQAAATLARIYLRSELKISGAWTLEDEEKLSK